MRLRALLGTYHMSQCQQETEGGVRSLPTRQLTHVIHLSVSVTVVCLTGQVQCVVMVVELHSACKPFSLQVFIKVYPDDFRVVFQLLTPHPFAHGEIFLMVLKLLI